jgi:rhomboid protease GluP
MQGPEPVPEAPGSEDDEIPVIQADMLHHEVDFESGMSPYPLVSLVLIGVCTAVFVCQELQGAVADVKRLDAIGALVPQRVQNGEVWRMISAMFLHGSLDHLLGNLIILYILGMACEHGFGRARFITLFVATGVLGSLFSLAGGRVSVGASGAIFGLASAIAVMFWRRRRELHLRDRRIGVVLALWAGFQFFLGTTNPRVDNLAHLGGVVAGAVLGFFLRPSILYPDAKVPKHPVQQAALALACTSLVLTSIFFLPRLVQ